MLVKNALVSIATLAMLTACVTQPTNKTSATSPAKNTGVYLSPCLQISLQNKNSALKVGYGSGRSVAAAKQLALYDIAKQLEVNVSGSEESTAKKTNNNVNTQFNQNVKSRATKILTSVDIACSDTNDPTGLYHFALRYDQRPLVDIFAEQLAAQFWQQRPATIHWQGPSLIIKSDFIEQLEKRLTDKNSTSKATMNVLLFRKNQQWQLIINGVVRILHANDYKQLINWNALNSIYNNKTVNVQLQNEFGKNLQPHLYDGDDFHFKVKSSITGYLSVFDVYEDGRVTKIRENLKIKNTIKLPEHKGSFSAGLLKPNQATRDQYVFLITKDKINANSFHQLMLETKGTNESNNYSLNTFLQWIDKQPISVATALEVETIPR